MGKLSINKGKSGEREIAKLIRDYGFAARRGQQFAGGNDSPDVITSIPGTHIEVKRVEALQLYAAMEQASNDAAEGDMPVVLHRKNNKEWVAILKATDWLDLMRRITNG